MKYFLISLYVVFLFAIAAWWSYGIFQSEVFTLSEKYTFSSLVVFSAGIISFGVGVAIHSFYSFNEEE